MEVSEDSVEPAGEEDVGLFGVAGGASPFTGLGGALRSAIDVGWSRKKICLWTPTCLHVLDPMRSVMRTFEDGPNLSSASRNKACSAGVHAREVEGAA